jgi:membrane-associated phospholipid phosphatase
MPRTTEYITRAGIRLGSLALLVGGSALDAQTDTTRRVDKTFFTRRDLVIAGAGIAASVGVAVFDERIATWTRTPGVQGTERRRDVFSALTNVNETPLTIAAAATYAGGRLTGSEVVADVGLHTTEALALTVVVAEMIRAPLGRARPRASPADAFVFEAGAGFTKFENRAYPSMHAAAAFATASALVGEVRARAPEQTKVVAPLLYTAAMIPGLTRMYLDQHWASDIVSGTILGAWLGSKVVSYAHGHERSKLDRFLLGASVIPTSDGVAVAVSLK